MATVTFEQASRRYPGQDAPAVDALDLRVEDGEFMVLVGPSGCGKSTTLRMLAGLEPCDRGYIHIGDRDVTMLPPKDRDIAMVFQNYALYPHMTVGENIGFHLRIAKVPKDEIARRVLATAQLLDLEPFLRRKPAKLSGGQRQRVAMGRAIVRQPQVFLMDEPLSNLDAKLRVQTRTQIAQLQRRFAVSTVYVTHDQVEAMTMGDRVAVMKDGLLLQCDSPKALFNRPATAFVAGFIGSPAMNLITGSVSGEGAMIGELTIPLSPEQRAALTGPQVVVGVRPEGLEVLGADEPGIDVVVDVVEELGSDTYLYTSVRATEPLSGETHLPTTLTVRRGATSVHARGEELSLRPIQKALHLFDAATGARLPD
ncbi:MAG: sn-glycerol-3-phosphate ABC transporter ATP-binding protein UgpC [Acidimicrobiia bacterium]|nr:sn-glycerol-3-phosphate ABC transporter ATP-binding protein UgpC [Acidimicrobiia bacterium]